MNLAPVISSFSPATVDANSASFTLTITGTNFVSSSAAYWNGTPLSSVVVSGTTITATVPQASVPTGGNYTIQVFTPESAPEEYDGGLSNTLIFTANMTLSEAQIAVCLKIDDFMNAQNSNWFTWNGDTWDCNLTSKQNIIGTCVLALANGGNLPAGTVWRDYSNVNVPVTGSDMIHMGIAMFSFLSGNYQVAWAHKTNVRALTTVEAVLAYDYQSTLWLNPNTEY